MTKTLLTFFLVVSSMVTFAQQDPWLTDLSQKWANAQKYSLEIANLMPETNFSFKPTAEEMSFGEQVVHTASNMVWLSSTYLTSEKPPALLADFKKLEAGKMSKSEILDVLTQSFDYASKAIQSTDPTQLGEEVKFFAGPMARRKILLLLHDHVTHHRGQMIVYLRLNNIKPARYVGW
ncbi:MAG: DinB family protein [Spirosomataceae bacterium]